MPFFSKYVLKTRQINALLQVTCPYVHVLVSNAAWCDICTVHQTLSGGLIKPSVELNRNIPNSFRRFIFLQSTFLLTLFLLSSLSLLSTSLKVCSCEAFYLLRLLQYLAPSLSFSLAFIFCLIPWAGAARSSCK